MTNIISPKSNKSLIKRYQYSTNYLAMPVENTDDWCFFLGSNGFIKKMAIGGENCAKMCGISFWTESDGKKLSKDVELVFNSYGGKECYWDQVPCEKCLDHYEISIRECRQEDIVEIDTFNELVAIDGSYAVK